MPLKSSSNTCVTRSWTTIEQRASSIDSSKGKLGEILTSRDILYLEASVELELNRTLTILYKQFTVVFEKREVSKTPTLSLVSLSYYKMLKNFHRSRTDSQVLQLLKASIVKGMHEKFYNSIKTYHWIRKFLDSTFCTFLFMSRQTTSDIDFNERVIIDVDESVSSQVRFLRPPDDGEPAALHRRVKQQQPNHPHEDFFLEMPDDLPKPSQVLQKPLIIYDECSLAQAGQHELEQYKIHPLTSIDVDVLHFWKNSSKLTLLTRIGRKVTGYRGIQARSGQSERLYSDCSLRYVSDALTSSRLPWKMLSMS